MISKNFVTNNFLEIIPNFLIQISKNHENWKTGVRNFSNNFIEELNKNGILVRDKKEGPKILPGQYCPTCNPPLMQKRAKYGPLKICSSLSCGIIVENCALTFYKIDAQCPICNEFLALNRGGIFCRNSPCKFSSYRKFSGHGLQNI